MATVKGLPPIGQSPPLPATPRGEFAQEVALRTGLNPWVVYAWTVAENTDNSVKRRPYNFLNLKSFNGKGGVKIGARTYQARSCDPATDGGCFPGFGDVRTAAAATADLIQRNFPTIRKSAGKPAGPQLQAIGHSNWGTSGSLLQRVYNQVLVTVYRGDNLPKTPGTAPNQIPELPGGEQLPYTDPSSGGLFGALAGISDFFGAITGAIRALFSLAFWLRVGQVVAGGVLILAGAFILSRGELAGVAVGRG
jgi:hypothetical protein